MTDDSFSHLGNREHLESLSTEELERLVMDFRLTSAGANLTKELKDEWRVCEEYCAAQRKKNWTSSGAQGVSKGGRQLRMKLPRLVELETEKRFGPDWMKDEKAHNWQWKTYPQFRLIEKK